MKRLKKEIRKMTNITNKLLYPRIISRATYCCIVNANFHFLSHASESESEGTRDIRCGERRKGKDVGEDEKGNKVGGGKG
jgi:hypothetical protein